MCAAIFCHVLGIKCCVHGFEIFKSASHHGVPPSSEAICEADEEEKHKFWLVSMLKDDVQCGREASLIQEPVALGSPPLHCLRL